MTRETWSKEVKKRLIDEEATVTDLAQVLGYSRQAVSESISGRRPSLEIDKAISESLGVELYEE